MTTEDRNEIISCVRRHGSSASDAILDPTCSIFHLPFYDGLIGYKINTSCAVVYGDPICSWENRPELVSAFHKFCSDKNLNIVYLTASSDFANWAIKNTCGAMIAFGDELVIDPHDDPKARKGVNGSLVRRKVRHALKEGALVQEYIPTDPALEADIEKVGTLWLEGREGLQIHTSNVHLFLNREGKRWFYATYQGQVVGTVVLNELKKYNGWLLNHLMHTKDAPHGTPELLLTTALDTLAKEGCTYVTFGSVPSASLGEIVGLNPVSSNIARLVFKCVNYAFHLNGKMKFWEKFHPETRPSYLLFSRPKIGLSEIRALANALHVTKGSDINSPN